MQAVARIEYMSLAMGTVIRRNPENRYIVHEILLQRAWQLYADKSLDIPRFLSCACHFLGVFDNDLLIRTTDEVDFFVIAPIHDICKYYAKEILTICLNLFLKNPH